MEPGTTKSLVAREASGLFPSAQQWQTMSQIADVLIKSGLLPAHVKTPQAALAVMLKGSELGVPAMQALSSIVVVQGKPTCNAELMLALCYRDHGDEAMIITRTTAEECSISYKRRGWKERQAYSFTMEDAQRAGLAESQTWKKYPAAMLRARAISAVARMAFPDSIAGMYVYEEMGLPVEVEGGEQVVVEGSPSNLAGYFATGEQAWDATKAAVAHDLAQAAGRRHEREQESEPAAPAQPPVQPDEPPRAARRTPSAADWTQQQHAEQHAPAAAPQDEAGEGEQQVQARADPHAALRAEVVALLAEDGKALDLLQRAGKGILPPQMDGAQLQKTRDWLLDRKRMQRPPGEKIKERIERARTREDVLTALADAQGAKDRRTLTSEEYAALYKQGQTRIAALAQGPLTARAG